MDTSVVHKIHLHDLVSAHLEKLRDRPSEQVVADMSEVERLVGVWRRIFHHDGLSCRSKLAEVLGCSNFCKDIVPIHLRKRDVQEALDRIISGDFRAIGLEPLSYCISCVLRSSLRYLEKRENDQSIVPLELLSRYLYLKLSLRYFNGVKRLNCFRRFSYNELFRCHYPK